MPSPRAAALIKRLNRAPHPEGGHYRQIYKSPARVQVARGERAALTTIYFLLAAGEQSRWHQVRSEEAWHFYEGDPLELLVMDPGMTAVETIRLGSTADGARVHVVPADWWQAARPCGEYALVGCTVAPGFEFADFAFLTDVEPLQRIRPDLVSLA